MFTPAGDTSPTPGQDTSPRSEFVCLCVCVLRPCRLSVGDLVFVVCVCDLFLFEHRDSAGTAPSGTPPPAQPPSPPQQARGTQSHSAPTRLYQHPSPTSTPSLPCRVRCLFIAGRPRVSLSLSARDQITKRFRARSVLRCSDTTQETRPNVGGWGVVVVDGEAAVPAAVSCAPAHAHGGECVRVWGRERRVFVCDVVSARGLTLKYEYEYGPFVSLLLQFICTTRLARRRHG